MTDPNPQATDDQAEIEAANERLRRARERLPQDRTPVSLPGAIAQAQAALERRWARDAETDTTASNDRLERITRQTALQPVREQVPMHCRGKREELVTRMDDKFFRAVHAWEWGSSNLVLLGNTGAGKTTAAAYLLRRLCGLGTEHGAEDLELARLIRWQSCRELTSVIREYPLGQGTPDTLIRCQNARLLILDDLGAGDDKQGLERILDVRYMRGWATVTTSGLRYRDLVTAMGEALVRRLVETHGKKGRVLQVFPKPEGTKQ